MLLKKSVMALDGLYKVTDIRRSVRAVVNVLTRLLIFLNQNQSSAWSVNAHQYNLSRREKVYSNVFFGDSNE